MTTTPKIISLCSAGPGILAVLLETVSKEKPSAGGVAVPDLLDLDPAKWLVNGAQPSKIHRSSLPWYETPVASDGTVDITTRHTIYLTLPQAFQDGAVYALSTPYGTAGLTFGSKTTLAPCIKVNQAAYAKASTARWALLGIWRGDGGTMPILPLPAYEVIRKADGAVIHKGTAVDMGDDVGLTGPKSGEHVYKLDLAPVPEGGPYVVSVPGVGCSHPFYVGGQAERNAAEIALHSLTIARCGQELKAPWSTWNRPACHLQVTDTRVPIGSADFIQVSAGAPTFPIRGLRHDAGDYDRRPTHTINAIGLLTHHEARPGHSDDRMGIPEDGNGIPGLLSEALWDVQGWCALQITDTTDPLVGGVRSGTEQGAHPTYGVNSADHDRSAYGTWGVDGPIGSPGEGLTAYVAGIFAHASRLVRPYDVARSDDFLRRARLAWGYHASRNNATAARSYNLYGSLQLYLTTGESAFHDLFKAQATALLVSDGNWPWQYRPGNFGSSGAQVQTVHFASYTLPTSQPVDTKLVDAIKGIVTKWADNGGYHSIKPLTDPYPVAARNFLAWGTLVSPGRFDAPTFASLYATDPTKQQQYINTMSVLADSVLGLNGMGMSFVVGLGVEQPNCPGHLDSFYAEQQTGHPIAGVMVYGPQDGRSGYDYQKVVTNKLYPDWDKLPVLRRYAHGWGDIAQNEDSVWEVRVWFTILMHFLHDASKDPAPPPPPLPQPGTGVELTATQVDALRRVIEGVDILRPVIDKAT